MNAITHQADPHKKARLRWRGRRGLLENDLFVERFFNRYEDVLTDEDVVALDMLFDLSDNDLLDLLLRRKNPQNDLNTADVCRVLEMLRSPL
jgi:antitoxin CptB